MFCNSLETLNQCIHKFTWKDYSALEVQTEISSKARYPKLLCCSFILPICWGQATLIERCDELTRLLYEQVKRRSRTYCRTRVMSRCSHRGVRWQKWSFDYTTVHARMACYTVITHLTTCGFADCRLGSTVALVTLSASIFPRMNSDLQNCRACSSERPMPLRKRPYCMRPPCRRWWFSLRLWWSCLMQSGKDFADSWRRRSEEERWAPPAAPQLFWPSCWVELSFSKF